mmetsp:Transcript_1414/g.2587  ORF Transcript_1414/g.2587 Transcript_1414/m.2587 type:complete len:197 (-) Transcript_1414:257-847(-)
MTPVSLRQDQRRVSQRSRSLSICKKSRKQQCSSLRGSSRKIYNGQGNYEQNSSPSIKRDSTRYSTKNTSYDDTPKLMSCFETPSLRTVYGSKNSENWNSFYSRYSDSKRSKCNSKQNICKEDPGGAGGDHGGGQRTKRSFWKTVVTGILKWDCTRSTPAYDSDYDCEWMGDRMSSFNEYSWKYRKEEEKRRIQLMA